MAKFEEIEIETHLVPSPVKCTVMLPIDYYQNSTKVYPLMLFLHGGDGDRGFLENRVGQIINNLWNDGITTEMVIATPDCDRSLYLDYLDGTEKWESFVIKEFLPYLQKSYRVIDDTNNHFNGGISMGGLGALRMGFKCPKQFGIILSFEPGIEPALQWGNRAI